MNYRNMSEVAGMGIAATIRAAVWSMDRAKMLDIGKQHGGLGRVTNMLVAAGFMTKKERFAALAMNGNRIRNESSRIRI